MLVPKKRVSQNWQLHQINKVAMYNDISLTAAQRGDHWQCDTGCLRRVGGRESRVWFTEVADNTMTILAASQAICLRGRFCAAARPMRL